MFLFYNLISLQFHNTSLCHIITFPCSLSLVSSHLKSGTKSCYCHLGIDDVISFRSSSFYPYWLLYRQWVPLLRPKTATAISSYLILQDARLSKGDLIRRWFSLLYKNNYLISTVKYILPQKYDRFDLLWI